MNRISLKAVALSALLVLGLDLAVGTALLLAHGGELFSQELTEEQVSQALRAMASQPSYLLGSMVLGTLTTVAGGYAVARMARQYPYFNGLALGVVGTVAGLLLSSDEPGWFTALGLVTTLPAALLGAHLAARRGAAKS